MDSTNAPLVVLHSCGGPSHISGSSDLRMALYKCCSPICMALRDCAILHQTITPYIPTPFTHLRDGLDLDDYPSACYLLASKRSRSVPRRIFVIVSI